MGGRAVEGTGLENRQTCKRFVGSNPTPSAIFQERHMVISKSWHRLVNVLFLSLLPFLSSTFITLTANPTFGVTQNPITIRVFHFNDVYEVCPKKDPLGNEYGGLAKLKTLIEEKKRGVDHSLLTFGGDLFPATIESTPLSFQEKIKLMNQFGIQGAVLGNHEFDEGTEEALAIVQQSTFPWIVANIKTKGSRGFGKTVPYKMFHFGSYKVALVGFILPETRELSKPGPDVTFINVVESAKPLVQNLKKEGVDFLIALTHQTLKEDEMLLKAFPEIDLVLGGHEHRPIALFVNQKQMIFKAGYDAEYLGILDLKIGRYKNEEGTHVYVAPSWQLIPVRHVKPNPTLQANIDNLKKAIPQSLFQPLANLEVSLDARRSQVNTQQTSMGRLVTMAFKQELGADIALINGGSIRGNELYPRGAVLTQRDILRSFPFQDEVVVCRLSGKQLKAWLEYSVKDVNGAFLQASGLTISYDPLAPVGQRVSQILVNDAPLKSQQDYSVATVDYLTQGHDGFGKVCPQDLKKTGLTTSKLVIDYLEKHKVITTKNFR
jgi:5'-nucleotidase / UDP-sugar diphosphatase